METLKDVFAQVNGEGASSDAIRVTDDGGAEVMQWLEKLPDIGLTV